MPVSAEPGFVKRYSTPASFRVWSSSMPPVPVMVFRMAPSLAADDEPALYPRPLTCLGRQQDVGGGAHLRRPDRRADARSVRASFSAPLWVNRSGWPVSSVNAASFVTARRA